MSEKYLLKSYFGCKYSDYSPYGNGYFGTMLCYIKQSTKYIKVSSKDELWEIYDEATSGVTTRKRTDFNRLIEDCMAGKIDYVITKSVSRFARNTLDTLKYTRQLKEKNIPVFFEKENINTGTMDSKLILSIREKR